MVMIDGQQYWYDFILKDDQPRHVVINSRLSTMISTNQAGYGRFNITTVWLDAAEPERPTMDTVGQFLFSEGDQWWRKDQYANQMITLLSSSDYHQQGTDAEIGSAWVQQHTRTFAEGFARQVVIFIFMRRLYCCWKCNLSERLKDCLL